MARCYTNENFPSHTAIILRDLGHDILTTQEAGRSDRSIPDEDVLAFAVTENRILLTLNRRDFIRLHRLDSNHFGIIICTENKDFEALALEIHEAIAKAGSLEQQLIRVYKTNS